VRVSIPTVRLPAGTVMAQLEAVQVPLAARVCAPEVYVPLLRVTVPVGVPLEPITETVTVRFWALVTGLGDGETFMVTAPVPVDELQLFTSCVASTLPMPEAIS
jgi:hypothetical protein